MLPTCVVQGMSPACVVCSVVPTCVVCNVALAHVVCGTVPTCVVRGACMWCTAALRSVACLAHHPVVCCGRAGEKEEKKKISDIPSLWWHVLVALRQRGGQVERDRAPTDVKKKTEKVKENILLWLVLVLEKFGLVWFRPFFPKPETELFGFSQNFWNQNQNRLKLFVSV